MEAELLILQVWSGNLGQLVTCIQADEGSMPVTSVAISTNGERLAAGFNEGQVKMYDLLTGALEWQTRPHTKSVRCIKYHTSGDSIVTGADDCKIKVSFFLYVYGVSFQTLTCSKENFRKDI